MNQEKHRSSKSIPERIFGRLGVRAVDIPPGLIVFNGLLWPEWIAVFVFSVRRRPLRYLKIHSVRFQNFHTNLRSWKIYHSLEKYTINSANKVSSYKWFQRMGKRLGTSSADLTYGTIETIIIYNALLPICWAPLNFVAAVTFIRFYRSYWNKGGNNNDDNNNGESGSNASGNTANSNSNSNSNPSQSNDHGNKMNIANTKFLFNIGHGINNYHRSSMNWFGIQPSTLCLRIGSMNKYENNLLRDIFNYRNYKYINGYTY